MRLYL